MSYKDIWFAEMERKLNEKLDAGKKFDQAYEEASFEALDSATNKLADMADRAKKIARGE